MQLYLAALLALLFSLDLYAELGARELKPTVTGDGASGDSFGVRAAVCGSEVIVSAMGDVLPSAEVANGLAQGSVYRFARSAGELVRVGKLTATNGSDSDLFGFALACDAQLLLVGARDANGFDEDAGAVYLYERVGSTWLARGELAGSRQIAGARFGAALSLSAQWLSVGAPGEGTVYLYPRSGLTFGNPRRIVSSDLGATSGFGSSVLLSNPPALLVAAPDAGAVLRFSLEGVELARVSGAGGLGSSLAQIDAQLLVGSPFSNGGSVQTYNVATLAPQQILPAPEAGGSDRFGHALLGFGQKLAVSAIGRDAGDGAVYLFARNLAGQWQLERTLKRNTGAGADLFGAALADDAGQLLVGAQFALAAEHPGQGLIWRFSADLDTALQVDSGKGAALDRFGQAVALDGERALIGSFLADTRAGLDSGVAEIFRRTPAGWQLEATLKPLDATSEQRFGISVALSGDRALVGSYWDVVSGFLDAGSAYVFERNSNGNWQQVQKLVSPEPRTRAYFGFAVALDGERAVVGARGDSVPETEQGSVVFFQIRSGQFEPSEVLRPADSAVFDAFGASVALRGDTALIGAPGALRDGCDCGGRAYLLRALPGSNQWRFLQSLQDDSGGPGEGFGLSVALGNSLEALVGSPFAKIGALNSAGVALLFAVQGEPAASWNLQSRLQAPSPAAGDGFGISVALNASGALVGASGTDNGSQRDVGAAYFFSPSGVQRLQLPTPRVRSGLGRALALSGTRALVGAPAVDRDNPQEGAVYEFLADPLFAHGFEQ